MSAATAAGQGVGIIGTETPVNYPPVADPVEVAALAGAAVSIQLSGDDANGDPITFSIVSSPANGTLTNFDSTTGSVLYSPNPGFTGIDSFVFRTNDGIAESVPATVSIAVMRAATTTAFVSSANPSVTGQPVTLTATVTAAGGGVPTGTVTFFDGPTSLGTGTLNAVRQATLTTSAFATGAHALTARYGGAARFESSASPVLVHDVNRAATTTSLASSGNPSALGQAVTFTATVNVTAPGAGTPNGTVTFKDGAVVMGTGILNAIRQATFSTSTLPTGTHPIAVEYGGDGSFSPSTSSTLMQTVFTGAGTTTTVTSSANPSVFGQPVTFTATVAGSGGGSDGTPTGSVTFLDGLNVVGAGTLNAAGQAAVVTSALSVGTHAVTSQYAGDANFGGSASATLTQVIAFADVQPTDLFFAWIEALATAGITGGCSLDPPHYCPEAPVTRGQMAVFLERGIHGPGFQPPFATGLFVDVPIDYLFARWIEQLARDGITGGCSAAPPQYCPEDVVTRGQMAVFLLRAKHGSAYQPSAATGLFVDVPTDHLFVRWIEQLAREGITGGCSVSPPQYCPEAPVTRGQMAVFLVRAFNLPM